MSNWIKRVFLGIAVLGLLAAAPAGAQDGRGQGGSGFFALSGEDASAFILPADMEPVQSLRLERYGLTYERYQQVFGDAKVLGGQVTLYRDDSNSVTTVIGSDYPDIVPTNSVRVMPVQAHGIVDRDIGPDGERIVDLMIDPNTGRYFYRVETRRAESRWVHWIGAQSGQVINKYDALMNQAACSGGYGYGVAFDDNDDSSDVKDLTCLTTWSGSEYRLRSEPQTIDGNTYQRQETHDQGSTRRPFLGPIATDIDDAWVLLGDESPAQPALVDSHYYAWVTDRYYLDRHGFDWVAAGDTDPDHNISSMVIHSHFTKDYNNAFWNGRYVAVGDGDQNIFRELSSLDVIGHELTHGVTDFTSNLIYQDESGALSESFSDMMGNSIEFYAESHTPNLEPGATLTPDWYIGEDIYIPEMGTPAPGFRNMKDPEEDGVWPNDHYSERYTGTSDNGGVHRNSAIPNHAYYLLVNGGMNASCASIEAINNHNSAHCVGDGLTSVISIGLADAEAVVFLAFIGLPTDANMCAARLATEATAQSLYGGASQQLASTTDAWVAVGLTDEECGLVAPDNTAPAAPSGLMATAGDGSVTLDWGDNVEDDLAGYNVYRGTTSGTHDTLVATTVVGSTYEDTNLTNDTTYYYVVTAVDTSGNESGPSTEASATPSAPTGDATTMHVEAIVVSRVNSSGGRKKGKAEVTVFDDLGGPVAGVLVDGIFEGDLNESHIVETGNDGVAVFITDGSQRGLSFTFCVTGITGGTLGYDETANVENCKTY